MRATAIEFRLRTIIILIIITLGFVLPWITGWSLGPRISLLVWPALELSRLGLLSFKAAIPVVIVVSALLAAAGACLRIWGSAYLGPATVTAPEMKAGGVMADGPYRHVRNPLYLGSWCMIAAIAFLMAPAGAMLCMVLLTVFFFRLILGEETFLTGKLGEPYREYLRAVPRLFPRLRCSLAPAGRKPRWIPAVISEVLSIGVFVTMAFLSWSYDGQLMRRAILVSFGVSLIVRGIVAGKPGAGLEVQ
jgi:protein-S-isoprenylcysteine O-methyltransferase Ste14